MSAGPAETHPFAPAPPAAAGWSWKKVCLLILLVFAMHVAFVFLLGAKKPVVSRAVTKVPVFQLADSGNELIRLTDPTLFVLPHAEDFTPDIWAQPRASWAPTFSWNEPPAPAFLPSPPAELLGLAFNEFMQTNRSAAKLLNFKPEPQMFVSEVTIESALPQHSTWQLAGEAAGRRLLNTLSVPTLSFNDVIAPSRVQLLVDPDGNVASTVLLKSSGAAEADQQALALARTLQFAPAERLMFGEVTFNWHTVPVATTNAP